MLAQYSAGKTYLTKHQLWTVPASEGKSRISHATALFLLMTGAVAHVHMVFPSQRLMQRDLEEFAYFWMLAGLADRVSYHVSLDFEYVEGSILVIDESDTLIFNDPHAFKLMMTMSRCICFTATPDDNNRKGAERQVLADIGLSKFEYGYPAELTAAATINETRALEDGLAVLAFL